MMGTWLPETCWATIRREIKNTKVTSSWFFLSTLLRLGSLNISFLVLAEYVSCVSYCTILLHLFGEVCTWCPYSYWLILPSQNQFSCSFLFRAFLYSNCIFNFPTECACVTFSKQYKYSIVYVHLVGKLKI